MNKKIIFMLCIASRMILGMGQEGVLTKIAKHDDLLPHLTCRLLPEPICIGYSINESCGNAKKIFHALSLTNKFFSQYYTGQGIQQDIISRIMDASSYYTVNANHCTIAKLLGCHKVAKKLDYFHFIAFSDDQTFTDQDLDIANSWYLNSSKDIIYPLLHLVIKRFNIAKAQLLINHPGVRLIPIPFHTSEEQCSLSFHTPEEQCPLHCVSAQIWNTSKTDENRRSDLLTIAKFLLAKMSPDGRCCVESYTCLMHAARANEKALAQLLLEHGANPWLLRYKFKDKNYNIYHTYDHLNKIPNHSGLKNAFTRERGEPKGWLMSMYKEIQQKKENKSL